VSGALILSIPRAMLATGDTVENDIQPSAPAAALSR
jgi:hypothetical protein